MGGKTRKSDAIEAAAANGSGRLKGEKEWKMAVVVVVVEEKERRWEEQE